MGPRKVSRTPKKLNKKFNKTRSKKQKGSGIASSRPRPIEPKVQNDTNDPNKVDDYLRLALEEESSESVGKYLKEGADPNMTINDPDKNEDVPAIIYAARHNKSSGIIEKLLKAGANVEQPYDTSTPLIEAAKYGNLQAVRILLDNSANINAKTRQDSTTLISPISYAILNEDIAMIKLMLEKREGKISIKDIQNELYEYPTANQEIITILKDYIANQTNQSAGRKRTRKYKKSNNKTLKK